MLPSHHAGGSAFPHLLLPLYCTSVWGLFSLGNRGVTNTLVRWAGVSPGWGWAPATGAKPCRKPSPAHPAARRAHGARTGRQAPAVATCCSRRMLHILLWGKNVFFFLCFFRVTVHVASVGVCAHTGVCVYVCARRCASSFPVFQFMQKHRCVFNLLQ